MLIIGYRYCLTTPTPVQVEHTAVVIIAAGVVYGYSSSSQYYDLNGVLTCVSN